MSQWRRTVPRAVATGFVRLGYTRVLWARRSGFAARCEAGLCPAGNATKMYWGYAPGKVQDLMILGASLGRGDAATRDTADKQLRRNGLLPIIRLRRLVATTPRFAAVKNRADLSLPGDRSIRRLRDRVSARVFSRRRQTIQATL